MSTVPEPTPNVELLLFEIADAVYGVDASQVRRIDRPGPHAIVRPELGIPHRNARALVFVTPEGEGELAVDGVRGVVNVSFDELRRLPPVTRGLSFAVGMWLGSDRPILLIDLPETARAASAAKEHHVPDHS